MRKLDGEQWRGGTCLGSSKDITERDGELLLEGKVLIEETDPNFNNTSSYIFFLHLHAIYSSQMPHRPYLPFSPRRLEISKKRTQGEQNCP